MQDELPSVDDGLDPVVVPQKEYPSKLHEILRTKSGVRYFIAALAIIIAWQRHSTPAREETRV